MAVSEFDEIESRYRAGSITKGQYIEAAYAFHRRLLGYPAILASRNAERIVITEDGVTMTTRDGVTLVCNPDDWRSIPLEVLNFGDFEPGETELLKSLAGPESVIADIGANVGWYSVQLGRIASKGRVIAFEPMPSTAAYLRRNLVLNGVENVEVYECGLAEAGGEANFFYQVQSTGASSAVDLIGDGHAVGVAVQIRRMDDVLAAEPRIDLMKCDVEGGELGVLRGGRQTIERTKPVIFIEMLRKWSARFGYHPNDIIAFLGELGYECFAVGGGGRLRRLTAVDEQTGETNFVMFHREKHADLAERANR